MPASDFASPGARAFLLEIAGLSVRYWCGGAPAAASVPNTGGLIQYADVEAIINVGDFAGSIDLAGGVAQVEPVDVQLASNQRFTADLTSDPAVVFGRTGSRSASAFARLASDILASDLMAGAGIINTQEDPIAVGFPASGICHIGPEAFHYTGRVGGTPGQLTGVTRAAAETRPFEHVIAQDTGSTPEVVTPCVNFRGRRAVLKMAPLYSSGAIGDYIEVQRGFLESSPVIDSDGLTVTVSVAPLTAYLDTPPAPNRGYATGLKKNWHHFTEGIGDTFEVIQEWPFYGFQIPVGAAGAGAVNVPVATVAKHQAVFDPGAAALNTPNHPRNGAIEVLGDVSGYAAGPSLTLYSPTPRAVSTGENLATARAREVKRVVFPTGSQEWPEAARSAIQAAWTPGTTTGRDGAWLDVALEVNGAGGSSIRATPQDECEGAGLLITSYAVDYSRGADGPEAYYWSGAASPYVAESMVDDRARCWFGLDAAPADRDAAFPQYSEQEGRIEGRWATPKRDIPRNGALIPIRGVADAYYQTGEPVILADGDVPIFAAGTGQTYLEVSYIERTAMRKGERKTTRIRITASAPDAASGGYLLTVAEEDRDRTPSFGSFPELGAEGDVRLTPVVVFDGASATTVLLEMLFSGSGRGVNDPTYDAQPFGANLNADDVESLSFQATGAPNGLDSWSFQAPGGVELRELLDPVLIATQTALTMQLADDGKLKLTRIRIGPEDRSQSVGSIGEGDWLDSSMPTWATDENIRNAYTFNTNYDYITDEPAREIVMNDQRSIAAYGEAESLSLDLRGVSVDGDVGNAIRQLLPLYSLLSATFADPRRTFEGEVSSGDAINAQLGAVYTFTCRDLKGYGDELGVTDAAGRIIAMRVGLWTAGASIRATHYDAKSTGWNAALLVTGVAGAVATVDPSNYTSGGDDLSFFAVGDTVRAVPRGDQDAATVHTVSAIGVGTITLNPAPAVLVGPDWGDIEPATYASAPTVHRELCYLGNAAGRINGGATEGYDWG